MLPNHVLTLPPTTKNVQTIQNFSFILFSTASYFLLKEH